MRDPDFKSIGKWFIYSILIGILTGLGATVFFYLLQGSAKFFLNYLGGYYPPLPGGESVDLVPPVSVFPKWILGLVPALGGLIAGAIIYKWAPEAAGHGTDAVIDAFHRFRGVIRKRVPIIKAISSAITIGSGGSAGREGPVAQIGAGVGSYLANLLRLSDRDRRLMLIAGAGGGIGSMFRAPLGGALFATEVLYREPEFEFEAIIPAIISSIVAYSVFASFFGWGVLFDTPRYLFRHPSGLFFYAILGILCVILGALYVKVFYGLRDRFFKKLPVKNFLKPAIGGLMLGIMAMFFPQVLGMGYGWIQLAIYGQLTIGLMIVLVFAKIFATSFTISSGGSGGVFAPSLFIGGMLGGAFGQTAHLLFPDIITQPTAFVLVGMGAFFAGVAKVPISSLIMVSEMTGSYGLLVPLMLSSSIAYLFTRKWNLYEKQVSGRIDSPAHLGDFVVDILAGLKVQDALTNKKRMVLIPQHMPLREILTFITDTSNSYFPVVDDAKRMVGIMSLDDIRNVMFEEGLSELVNAKDMATSEVITVTQQDNLQDALRKFTLKNIEEIPVVDIKNSRRVIGMLNRRDVIAVYNNELQKSRLG
ncbi:MAG: chloride channel protein [Deltaproteobacteria bacterium CG12_big_fil_rev_8_21_14_0_65_43_10]|nr:MAG: chloride channel protein [Deltaproteobacteria bacterium CG2_30_43_15]PIQ45987.1 MAG: chloride channel protein [Deltaproteobacteria bacterium CG12_big_fil_rev_8_21_14_0_65_43_10]PIX22946.1 MAG: chloride channel protein [Deltaproteobacteria bacterium CG_4_8_14_3_um_filter_43_13]